MFIASAALEFQSSAERQKHFASPELNSKTVMQSYKHLVPTARRDWSTSLIFSALGDEAEGDDLSSPINFWMHGVPFGRLFKREGDAQR